MKKFFDFFVQDDATAVDGKTPEKDIFFRKFLSGEFLKNHISIFNDIVSIILMKTVADGFSYQQLVVLEAYTA